jgi:hypothetical protein
MSSTALCNSAVTEWPLVARALFMVVKTLHCVHYVGRAGWWVFSFQGLLSFVAVGTHSGPLLVVVYLQPTKRIM